MFTVMDCLTVCFSYSEEKSAAANDADCAEEWMYRTGTNLTYLVTQMHVIENQNMPGNVNGNWNYIVHLGHSVKKKKKKNADAFVLTSGEHSFIRYNLAWETHQERRKKC